MKIEVGKCYVTAGGYVAKIIANVSKFYYSSIETSPGVSRDGKNSFENSKLREYPKDYGWGYLEDGSISGLSDLWNIRLKIVEELPIDLPEKLSKAYKWAGGYPQFRTPKKDEFYLSNSSDSVFFYNDMTPAQHPIYSDKRFILEKIPSMNTPQENPEDWVEITDLDHIDRPDIDQWTNGNGKWLPTIYGTNTMSLRELRKTYSEAKYRCKRKDLPKAANIVEPEKEVTVPMLPDDYEFTSNPPEYRLPKCDEYYYSPAYCGVNQAMFGFTQEKYYIVKKKDETPSVPKSEHSVTETPKYPRYFQSNDMSAAFVKVLGPEKYVIVYFDGQESLPLHGPIEKRFDYRCEFTEQEALAKLNAKVFSLRYWTTEPVGHMLTAAKKSFRYIVVTSVLSAASYTVLHPTKTIDFVKSCLPKINIKFNS